VYSIQYYVCQWLTAGLWFSPVSSTKETDRHYITEIFESEIKRHSFVLSCFYRCPLSPVVSKASAGAMEVMNISQVKSHDELITFLQVINPHPLFIRPLLLQWKSSLIRGPTSVERDNLLVFSYLSASEIWPDQRGGLSWERNYCEWNTTMS
jgi:hypothetical protein